MAAALLSSPVVAGVQAAKPKFVTTPKVNPTVHGLGASLRVKAEEGGKVATVDRSKDTLFFADENSLTYLDGTLPGDYGFDPFGLLEPGNGDVGFINPSWLRYSEVIHGRFAMLGAAGCITPEILSSLGVIPESTGIVWYRNGVIPPAGSSDVYWCDPYTLFFVEVVAMQFAELRRLQDYRKPGSMGKQYFLGMEGVLGGSGDPSYPGGAFFNMFNLGKTEESMKVMKTREIKNGRLAMMAMFGFGSQAILTGKGPYQNLLDHLADPFNNNILTNWTSVYGQL
ncbi:hypothetical protein BSKO_07556 [Bryopsis sp. KO-2023]|nr:hypothetical protein BSKO_07556 [Bryopsis sp. KO-2023]